LQTTVSSTATSDESTTEVSTPQETASWCGNDLLPVATSTILLNEEQQDKTEQQGKTEDERLKEQKQVSDQKVQDPWTIYHSRGWGTRRQEFVKRWLDAAIDKGVQQYLKKHGSLKEVDVVTNEQQEKRENEQQEQRENEHQEKMEKSVVTNEHLEQREKSETARVKEWFSRARVIREYTEATKERDKVALIFKHMLITLATLILVAIICAWCKYMVCAQSVK